MMIHDSGLLFWAILYIYLYPNAHADRDITTADVRLA